MELPTHHELLECVRGCADQYLCPDLSTLIAKYARASLEIITQEGTMYFDDETRTWMCMPFNQKPQTHNLAKLNDKIYAVGGSHYDDAVCVKYYDANRHWTWAASMHIRREGHGVGVLNSKLYAVGGYDDGKVLSSVECYDDISNQWTTVASMNTTRYGHGVAVLNGKLYAVGGHDGSNVLSGVECYDDVSNQWTLVASHGAHQRLASMNKKRWLHGVGVLNGKLYAMGGQDSNNIVSSVESYDDVRNQWITVASMLIPRSEHRIQVFNGKIYAVGGYNSTGTLSSVECYDEGSDTWTAVPEMTIDEKYKGFVP